MMVVTIKDNSVYDFVEEGKGRTPLRLPEINDFTTKRRGLMYRNVYSTGTCASSN
jgi:hypothetical protein